MKLLIATLLLTISSVANAFIPYNLGSSPSYVENENTPTWGVDNRLGDAASISYSFATSNYDCHGGENNCFSLDSFMPNGYQDVIASAFNAWASESNLSFTEVTDQPANIVIGGEKIDSFYDQNGNFINSLGHVSLEVKKNSSSDGITSYINSAGVHFDSNETWALSDDDSGRSLFSVALHEIGHTLGLNHSDDPTALMYYKDMGTRTLQADDIEGIQYLYGASVSPVPEASTYLMFLLGLAMVAGYGRRAVIRQA